MMLYTSVNRVRLGQQWCGEANSVSTAYITKHGLSADDEIPYENMLSEIGLADTLVALGAPHPRCRAKAELVLHRYLLALYEVAKELCDRCNVDFVDLSKIINVVNRKAQAKQLSATLRHLQYSTYDPILDNLFFALRMLLSEESSSVKAVFAGKRILAAWKLADSGRNMYEELVATLSDLMRYE